MPECAECKQTFLRWRSQMRLQVRVRQSALSAATGTFYIESKQMRQQSKSVVWQLLDPQSKEWITLFTSSWAVTACLRCQKKRNISGSLADKPTPLLLSPAVLQLYIPKPQAITGLDLCDGLGSSVIGYGA